MIEIRKDYIFERWSYIASDRGKRPEQFEKKNGEKKDSVCYFCPVNENLTPPEIGRMKNDNSDSWKVRWFLNKFPIVDSQSDEPIGMEGIYAKGGGFGYHEIIAETPDHEKQLADLTVSEIADVIKVYLLRMSELIGREGVNYVQIFKNSGVEAGTSLAHSHSQVVALSIVPRAVQEKVNAIKKYKVCQYCDIIKKEEKSERFVYANDDFVVFTPYAPRFNYEVLILPRKHYLNITELGGEEIENLAKSFQKVLAKLGAMNIPYNFYLHYSPKGENLHFHFEIVPRMNKWAGFELATDSYVITTSPEDAAKFYREG